MRSHTGKIVLIAAVCATTPLINPVPATAGARAEATVITRWNAAAERTVFTENNTPIPPSVVYFGYVSLAVYDAVVAIEGGYRPYLRQPRADRRASIEAAAATAAHHVLIHYFPASAANLDADLAASLADVGDGWRKTAGQRVGAGAAARLIAARTGDGLNADIRLTTTPAPGVWRPTPPAFADMTAPWLGFLRPLTLRSPTQQHLHGPDSIDSRAYRRDLAEVRAYGSATGSARTPGQTETALFFNANAVAQYQTAMRDQVIRRGYDAVRAARAFALLNVTTLDAHIRCWRAKYDFAYWRPITAIREGSIDPDPAWTPLVPNPPYPEYPSGHACLTGSFAGTLAYLFGARSIDLTLSSSVTGTTRHYDTTAALIVDTRNARIWLGLHFRRAMVDATAIGLYTARWVQHRHFQPTR
ncbi:MAG TPA: vanadium-dependent haloperoxidase [Actinoplanes sp.]|nr:vanadium-dependent haloperoxidase [Actinoplanes sp.]